MNNDPSDSFDDIITQVMVFDLFQWGNICFKGAGEVLFLYNAAPYYDNTAPFPVQYKSYRSNGIGLWRNLPMLLTTMCACIVITTTALPLGTDGSMRAGGSKFSDWIS